MSRSRSSVRSLLPLADRLASAGGLTAVLVGLALCAIVQQAVIAPAARRQPMAGPSPATAKSRLAAKRTGRTPRQGLTAPLERQVRKVVTQRRAALARRTFGVQSVPPPDVSPARIDGARGWAFGTSAIAPPTGSAALPDASLFVARRTARGWSVALAGTGDFVPLLRKAPTTVVPRDERPLLEHFSRTATPRQGLTGGLALPWKKGQSWTLRSAGAGGLRFGGGDGKVLAPGAGRLYRVCTQAPDRGMLMLIHSSGLASEFYGMAKVAGLRDGAAVRQGAYLGQTGTDRPCGGPQAPGSAAVGFTLCGANRPVALDGARIGGWTLHVAASHVSADRAGIRIDAGNPLLNFGIDTPSPDPSATGSPLPAPSISVRTRRAARIVSRKGAP